jgi:hypothetical protein
MREAQDSDATCSETDTDGEEIRHTLEMRQLAERHRVWAEGRRKRRAKRDSDEASDSETDIDIVQLRKGIEEKKVEWHKRRAEARKRRAALNPEATESETDSDFAPDVV